MHLKSITFHNYGPFKGTQSVEFDDKDCIIAVQGKYAANAERSNRAGKSSFVEGILYVLFGETRKQLKEVDLIFTGAEQMYVQAVFDLDGKDVTIKRGRTAANKPILDISGLTGTKTQKEKEFLSNIGLNAADFQNTYFFKQNDIHGFMASLPSERRKMLQTWLNLSRWEGFSLKAKTKAATLQAELSVLQGNLAQITTQLSQIGVIPDVAALEAGIKAIEERIQKLQDEISILQTKTSTKVDISQLNSRLITLESQKIQLLQNIETQTTNINRITKNIELINESKQDLVKLLANNSNLDEKIAELRNELSSVINDLNEIVGQIKSTQQQLNKICISGDCAVCPVDGNSCDKGGRITDFKAKLEKDLRELQTKRISVDFKVNELQDKIKMLDDIKVKKTNLEAFIDKLPEQEGQLNAVSNLQKTLSDQYNDVLLKISDIQSQLINSQNCENDNLTLTTKKTELLTVQSSLNITNQRLGQVKSLIDTKNKLELSKLELDKKIEDTKKQYYRWSYVTSILGKDGIPAILVENNLSKIEEYANLILGVVSSNNKLEFTTTKEITTKQTHCSVCGAPFDSNECSCGYGRREKKVKDEINLKIYENSRELLFAQDSGGGNILVSLSLRLALSKVLSVNSKCRMLVLDEIFGALDGPNRNSVSTLIFNALRNMLGFKQVFVITHTPMDVSGMSRIEITRQGDFSTISKI